MTGRDLSTWIALALILGLALLLRSLAAPMVFPGDGSVLLEMADGAYHARRAFYSFVNFPAVLWFDPLINHPDGATVPMPPLYDWALAALARLFGESQAVFERVAAWISPGPEVAAQGPHRVWIAGALHRLEVSEAQVRQGGRVAVGG